MRRLVGVLSGGMQNGYYNTENGRIYVNTQSGDPAVQVISHELTHGIEKSRFYAKLQQVVLKKIKADGLDLDTLAPMLKYSKKVNGTYYVVEAIPESKYKKFWVVSAYMEKADGGTQVSNADGPGNTPNASLASSSPASDSSVADASVDVKGNYIQQDQKNGSIQYTVEDLERARRAALARNETERTGILAGATTRQIQQAQRVGKLVRREVLFFSEGQDAAGGMQNGYYNTGDGRIYVNTQSGDPAIQVISHELTHSIEKSRFYAKLQQVVLKKIKADGLELDTLRAEKQALYERHGVTDVDVDAEIVAEYVAKNLLSDEQSIRSLVMESQTLGQRIMEFIDQLLAMLGNKNAQERELLSKARRYYQKALVDSWGQEATMRQGWFNGGYDSELDLQNGLGGNRYSINNTRNLDIREQMKRQRAGNMTSHDEFYYGETPSALEAAGLGKNPLVMSQADFKKSKSEKHNVPTRAMTRLAEALADPILSFELGDRIGVLTKDIDGDGKPLLIGILKNTVLDGESVNRIKSAYGLDTPQAWIKNQIQNGGKLRIYDIEKADRFLDGFGYKAEHPKNYRSGDIVSDVHSNYKGKFSISEEENLSELYRAQLTDIQNGLRGKQYSISEIEGEKQNYGPGVVLDTRIFNGVRPRDWGKVLGNYVYENLAGVELTMYDEYGNPETVYLARENDRVKKDGANRAHKVLDKLARYQGDNIRTLATIHLSEALETSKDAGYLNEHSHQWMDQNGWNYRKAYLQDRNGNIYEATLNIADGRDRRILYDINNIKKIDKAKATGGVVPSTKNGRGSLTNSGFENSIPENKRFGKRKFSISEEKNLPELYRAQLRALERLNLAASKEYDGYVEQLNRYKLQQRAKEVLEEYYAAVHENEEAINELKHAYRDWVREQNMYAAEDD